MGTPNKTTAVARDMLLSAFEEIGGAPALADWAREHRSEFYVQLWVKLLPLEARASAKPAESTLEQIVARTALAD